MLLLHQICLFKHWYPGEYWHPRWPTRDHVIPAHTFWAHMAGLWSGMALERLSMVRAIALAMSGKDNAHAARIAATDQAEAFPALSR